MVTHEQYLPQFKALLGDGSKLGAELRYAVQKVVLAAKSFGGVFPKSQLWHRKLQEAAGVGDALRSAQAACDGRLLCVILGDNIIGGVITNAVDYFRREHFGMFSSHIRAPSRPMTIDVHVLSKGDDRRW